MRDVIRQVRSRVASSSRPRPRLRLGFVGAGQHARANLYPCLPYVHADLMAVCARHLESAEKTARAFGARGAYADFREMFAREALDAVLVCVDARQHFGIAAAALDCGLHVFLEKPATQTLEEAQTLRDLERRSGKSVMVGFMKRHAPACGKARAIVNSRGFGRLAAIDLRLCVGAFPGEEEFLREVAIHHFDLIRFLAGDVVATHVERHRGRSGGLTLAVALKCVNGAVGTMRLSSGQSWRTRSERVELMGEGQAVVIENMISLRHYKTVDAPSSGGAFSGPGESFWEPNFTVPTVHNQSLFLNGFGFEIEHFVESLLAARRPQPDLSDFIASLRLVQAASDETVEGAGR